jgi:hypothetical protein
VERERFSRREVERSFRKFNDIVNDLFNAKFQTWGNMFTHLMEHCEKDPVMQVVTGPLKSNKNVNAEKWYNDALSSVGGRVGSGRYELPYDDEDKTALLSLSHKHRPSRDDLSHRNIAALVCASRGSRTCLVTTSSAPIETSST